MASRYAKNARTTLPADLAAGTLYGVIMLLQGVSLVALIFGPRELEPVTGLGMRAVLISFVVMNVIVALTSSYYFATAGPASSYSALLAVSAAEIVAALSLRQASPTEMGATVLVTLAASACVVGGVLLFLGLIHGGRLARHIPYPVSGGFLVGSGFLVLAGGFRVLTGSPLTWQGLGPLAATPALGLATAAVVALTMLVVPRFTRHYLVLPGIMFGGFAFFYIGFFLFGLSVDSARAQGMLFMPGNATSSPLPPLELLGQVQWDIVIGQLNSLLAVAVIIVLGVSLSTANLETATQRDADFDRELRFNGLANIATGLVGGVAGGMNSGLTLVMRRAGAATRFASVWASIFCFVALIVLVPALYYFPKPVLGGLLLGVGAGFLRDWLWDSYAKLPRAEYALIWAILILIVAFGLVPGVALGLIVAGLLFVYRYGQTQVVRRSVASSVHFSNNERSAAEVAQLKEAGKQAWTLTLQGYIFFGTASEVVDACRRLIEREAARYLILDFRLVQGVDVSAAEAFVRLAQVCVRARAKLVLTGVSDEILDLLRKSKLVPHPAVEVVPELNRAMEWVEDQLVEPTTGSLRDALAPYFTAESLGILLPYFQPATLEPGTALFHKGDPGNELYFVERGEVEAQLPDGHGHPRRLRKSGPGTIVGEMALYSRQPRSADVVAEAPCTVLKLSAAGLADLERQHPQVAIQFHSFLVAMLAARLASSTEEVQALA